MLHRANVAIQLGPQLAHWGGVNGAVLVASSGEFHGFSIPLLRVRPTAQFGGVFHGTRRTQGLHHNRCRSQKPAVPLPNFGHWFFSAHEFRRQDSSHFLEAWKSKEMALKTGTLNSNRLSSSYLLKQQFGVSPCLLRPANGLCVCVSSKFHVRNHSHNYEYQNPWNKEGARFAS